MVKVDFSQIDLIPPVGGSSGLPLSIRWRDQYQNAAPGASVADGWPIFDPALWKDKSTHAAVGPGGATTSQSQLISANVPKAQGRNFFETTASTHIGRANASEGNLLSLQEAVVNHQWATLDMSQLVQVAGQSRWAGSEVSNGFPFSTLTSTELGRFVGLGRRIRIDNARPGNATWQDEMFAQSTITANTDTSVRKINDLGIGKTFGTGSAPSSFNGVAFPVQAQGYFSKIAYPSGGFGAMWDNYHDSGFSITLGCSPYNATSPNTGLGVLFSEGGISDASRYSQLWALNEWSFRRPTALGSTPSGQQGWRTLSVNSALATPGAKEVFIDGAYNPGSATAGQPDYVLKGNTIQIPAVYDIQTTIATDARHNAGAVPGVYAVGRPDLGNIVVADTAGLIGFEGFITVTAFNNVTLNANSDGDEAVPVKTYYNGQTYGGLNIQVHSGTSASRNGQVLNDPTLTQTMLYGSDGAAVQPMSDALKTSASRKINNGGSTTIWEPTVDSNQTTFFNIRNDSTQTQLQPIGQKTATPANIINAATTLQAIGDNQADRLLGDDHQAGTTWNGTNKLTCAWMAEKIPTKVEVIPSIVGYKDMPVTVGASKLAAYGSATTITMKKPIVDYHIIVSVVNENQIGPRTVDLNPKTGAGALMGTGNIPLSRNNPASGLVTMDANFDRKYCEMWHSVVRINPDILEQVYIDPTHPQIAEYNEAACPNMVMPRHDFTKGKASQGWGLHQVTPFRPIANRTWSRVPRLCATIDSGGWYQRGGIGHLWDADVYGGELFIGADVMRPEDLSPSGSTHQTNPTDGQREWRNSIWNRGQINLDGSDEPNLPTGSELLIFKWSPEADGWYPGAKETSAASNPIKTQIAEWTKAGVITSDIVNGTTPHNTEINNRAGFEITESRKLLTSCWDVHDWVFPQIELMAYLGQEDKGNMGSDGSVPLHPTLHCSALRIMEDGKMMMAAIHRDNIKSPFGFPSAVIGNPFNPDSGGGACPPGYYQAGGECKPISGNGSDTPGSGLVLDPITGQPQQPPQPQGGGGNQTSATTVFGLVPSWGTLLGGTSARSLIMLWTDTAAVAGKVVQGRRNFGLDWAHVGDGGTTGQWVAKQRWQMPDTWWSGSRTSYWFPESGQRAIPITYGCYPETRCTSATLPRSTPWLDSDDKIIHGYPYRITGPRVKNNALFNTRTGVDVWWADRLNSMKLQRFIPTTPQFSDLSAGSNPHQELGWAGWSFKEGLFDPIGYDPVAYTFSDDPEKQISSTLPRANGAPFKDFMGYTSVINPAQSETELGLSYVFYPLDPNLLAVTQVTQWMLASPGTGTAPSIGTPLGPAPNLLLLIQDLINPALCDYAIRMNDYFVFNPQQINEFPFIGATKTGIYISYQRTGTTTSIPATHDKLRWGDMTIDIGGVATVIPPQFIENSGNRINFGGMAGWTHFGPLHYGASTNGHPYRTDRVWSMVHGGVGYDLPLHLLKPGAVHVRARAGGTNSLNLEMETPFHRTDNIHLEGLESFYGATSVTGFDKAGTVKPGGSRSVLGQYYLRTNLWTDVGNSRNPALSQSSPHGPTPNPATGNDLSSFWSDHPTDRFHAGAVPFSMGTDIDISKVSSLRYPMPNLGNSDEWSMHDLVSLGEQLQSSVDVHVSKSTKPFWDSGSIVTAQGIGYGVSDTTSGGYAPIKRSPQSGYGVPGSSDWGAAWSASPVCSALGMGQRILRTPEGTLHIFSQRRSAQVPQASSLKLPCWNHYKKPLFGDMFFNSKRLRPNPATDTYVGRDECRPILQHVETSLYSHSRMCGAAYATDSDGTIHCVMEVSIRATKGLTTQRAGHNLYYTYAKREFITGSPEPVYDWNWTKIDFAYQNINPNAAGEFDNDLRQPTLVCDAEDRLHLGFIQVVSDNESKVWYTSKLSDESNFITWSPTDSAYQQVSLQDEDTGAANIAASGPHSVRNNDYPKICLRGDNVPVFFWRGCSELTTEPNRNKAAVYVNVGRAGTATNDPSGRFSFSKTGSYQALGLEPMLGVHTLSTYGVTYYDAIIDERNRAQVVAIADNSILLSIFDAADSLSNQYTATEGLGMARLLYRTKAGTGHTVTEPTLTTDGEGNIHLVLAHGLGAPGDAAWLGAVYRDVSAPIEDNALWPVQWPGIPAVDYAKPGGAASPGSGGYGGSSAQAIFPQQTGSAGTIPQSGAVRHHLEIWWPSLEFDHDVAATDMVLRSINTRWLSVPSLSFDATNGWTPIGSAQTLGGHEDFPHYGAQLRYQRFWGHNSADLDMAWLTNELSWVQSMHEQSRLIHPFGMSAMYGFFDEPTEGIGIPGYY